MKSQYRIKISPPVSTDCELEGTLPRYFYVITDGLDGPIIKQGSSRSIKGPMGARIAADKTIKRLMLKEIPQKRIPGATNERIHFRLIHMQCCGQLLCWVNPRFPTHCPECGRTVYPQVKVWVVMQDTNAHLRYNTSTRL